LGHFFTALKKMFKLGINICKFKQFKLCISAI